MNTKIAKHTLIWTALIVIESLLYYKSWDKLWFWLFTFSNFAIALLSFYCCWYFGKKLCLKLKPDEVWRIMRHKEFWYGMVIVAMFIGLRLMTDLVLFGTSSGVLIWVYAIILLRTSLSFIISGFLFGIIEKLKQMITSFYKHKITLESQIETLETREIHLTSVTEAKERAIKEMDEKIEELQFNKEMLVRDLDEMEKRHNQLQVRNEEVLAQQQTMEQELTKLSALNKFMENDKKVTDMLYYRLNDMWEERVKYYKRILQLHGIKDTDHLPGLN